MSGRGVAAPFATDGKESPCTGAAGRSPTRCPGSLRCRWLCIGEVARALQWTGASAQISRNGVLDAALLRAAMPSSSRRDRSVVDCRTIVRSRHPRVQHLPKYYLSPRYHPRVAAKRQLPAPRPNMKKAAGQERERAKKEPHRPASLATQGLARLPASGSASSPPPHRSEYDRATGGAAKVGWPAVGGHPPSSARS